MKPLTDHTFSRHLRRNGMLTAILLTSTLSGSAAGLFTDIPGLSAGAQSSLIAHYDARTGVGTTGSTVNTWTPVDGNGTALPAMVVTSTQRGAGPASLISYDGTGVITFDDNTVSADGRFLSGTLANAASTSFTVFWRGHYDSGTTFETSGLYAYNIGPTDISHQRDDSGGGHRVEMYNGTTYGGDDITAYDDIDTVWSTVITVNTHTAFANGTNLNLAGTPANSVAANANIDIGAFSGSGFDFLGDMSHLIIFESALSDADRGLVEAHLQSIPEPSAFMLFGLSTLALMRRRRRN
jgi:hypothetical protein